ncbi:MAG: M28 family peptidase, partial [Myxococcales bacterium]
TFAPPRRLAEALPDLWRSDHAPFWDAGIPAALLTATANFRNPHYHAPGDVPDTLDYVFMARITRMLEGALRVAPER